MFDIRSEFDEASLDDDEALFQLALSLAKLGELAQVFLAVAVVSLLVSLAIPFVPFAVGLTITFVLFAVGLTITRVLLTVSLALLSELLSVRLSLSFPTSQPGEDLELRFLLLIQTSLDLHQDRERGRIGARLAESAQEKLRLRISESGLLRLEVVVRRRLVGGGVFADFVFRLVGHGDSLTRANDRGD